jgi:hypothetical protein
VLQPVQAFATQKPFAALDAHWLSPVHSTHCPAAVPLVAQTSLPSVRPVHPVAPGVAQPVHALATQKPFVGSFVQPVSARHSTHWPAKVPLAAQAVLPSVRAAQPVAPVVPQPVQAFATQKPFAGSFVQSVSATHSTH